jgi:hypothetical protein
MMWACEKTEEAAKSTGTGAAATPAAALPSGLFLVSAPGDAVAVKDVKAGLKPGDKVALVGRIGGSKEPFVDGRAMFTLVDGRVKACGEDDPDDQCPAPWDFCCEDKKDLRLNSATIRVLGPDGQPIKTGLKDVQGLKPLAKVTVVGTVAQAEAESFVVNATGMFVAK